MSNFAVAGKERIYYDTDGFRRTLDQMIRLEPGWARNRIIAGEEALAEIERLKRDLALLRSDGKMPESEDV